MLGRVLDRGRSVKLLVVNQTRYKFGAHATTMLINDHVNARLCEYGTGVKTVVVTLYYPPKTRPSRSVGGFWEFWDKVRRCPRVTFYKAKHQIEVQFVCKGISVRSIEADRHLTRDEAAIVATSIASALELIRPKVRQVGKFDYDRFLCDAQSALHELPAVLEEYLKA